MDKIRDIIERRPYYAESMAIPNHITQMRMWMLQQGIELLIVQDTPRKSRQKFIDKVWRSNKIDLYLEGIAELFVASGGILWFATPTKDGYLIHWFHSGKENNESSQGVPSQYKVYYDSANPLIVDEAIIRYSFKEAGVGQINASPLKWVRLRLRKDVITQEIFEGMPGLMLDTIDQIQPLRKVSYQNSFGFVPVWESPNKPYVRGDAGTSDFNLVAGNLESEETMRDAIAENIFQFGNATLITSRNSEEVLGAMNAQRTKHIRGSGGGWAESQGYRSQDNYWSQRKDKRKTRLPSVIGNVGGDEKFMFVTPDPISPDQSRYADEYRSAIHHALGGIDPLDTSFSTFGEVKTLHGKVAVTAKTKCNSLWKWGLCELFRQLIIFEEDLFMLQFKYWLGQQDKKIDLAAIGKEDASRLVWDQNYPIPFNVGLAPYGDVEVTWRHNGPVFEDSAQDKQQRSIMVRNLQELGVGSLEALDELYPNLSEKERRMKLTGVPFRIITQCTSAISNLLNIQGQMVQFPDDQDPSLSLAATVPITQIIKRIVQVLQTELNYGTAYQEEDDSTTISVPTSGSGNSNAGGISTSGTNPAGDATRVLPTDWNQLPVSPGSTVRTTQYAGVYSQPGGTTLRPSIPTAGFTPYYATPSNTYTIPVSAPIGQPLQGTSTSSTNAKPRKAPRK